MQPQIPFLYLRDINLDHDVFVAHRNPSLVFVQLNNGIRPEPANT